MVEKHYKDKQALVAELHEKLASASTVVITEYRGLKAGDMVKLRQALRGSNVEVQVVKNSLLRRAAQGTPSEELVGDISGPTAVAIGFGEPAEAAKVLSDNAKTFEKFNLQNGLVEKMVVSSEQLAAIAKLPGKDEMRAKAVGALQGPLAGLVFTLQGVLTQFAGTLQAKIEKESA
ncbi:MAG TPA: 50S ribosomal protein L10 [Abditibacteriaceae bacterium]|jgi:ribosomal protein L10